MTGPNKAVLVPCVCVRGVAVTACVVDGAELNLAWCRCRRVDGCVVLAPRPVCGQLGVAHWASVVDATRDRLSKVRTPPVSVDTGDVTGAVTSLRDCTSEPDVCKLACDAVALMASRGDVDKNKAVREVAATVAAVEAVAAVLDAHAFHATAVQAASDALAELVGGATPGTKHDANNAAAIALGCPQKVVTAFLRWPTLPGLQASALKVRSPVWVVLVPVWCDHLSGCCVV